MKRGKETQQTREEIIIMKTVDIVTTAKGYYVTRRYCGMNKGMVFFPFGTKKKERKAAEDAKDAFVKEWVGE